MPRPDRIVAGALVWLLAWAASGAFLPAYCSDDPDPDFSLQDTVQAGPLHVAPFLVIKDLGYDDNVRLGSQQRTGDYTITVGPGARAVMPVGRLAALSLRDEIDYAAFAREPDLNHVNNSGRAKLHLYLRDTTLFTEGEQISQRERPNNEVDFRIRTTATTGRVGFSFHPQRRSLISLHLDRTGYRYGAGHPDVPPGDDPSQAEAVGQRIAAILDRTETSVGLDGSVKIRSRTSALLNVRAGRVDFDEADPVRDSTTFSTMVGMEFDPSGPLRGSVRAGVKHLSPKDDAVDGFSGWIADTAVSARIAGRGNLKATYQRDTGFSIFGDNLFYIQDRRGLAYEHFVSGRLSLELGRALENVDYPIPIAGRDPSHRRDDIVSDTLSVRYRMGPSLRVGLALGRWDRSSTFEEENTRRNTIASLLEYTP